MANQVGYASFFEGMPIQWGDRREWSGTMRDFIRKTVVSSLLFYTDLLGTGKAPPRAFWEAIAQDPLLFLWLQETPSDSKKYSSTTKVIHRYLVAIFSLLQKEDKVYAAFVAIYEVISDSMEQVDEAFLAIDDVGEVVRHLTVNNWKGPKLLIVLRALRESGLDIREGVDLPEWITVYSNRFLRLYIREGVDLPEWFTVYSKAQYASIYDIVEKFVPWRLDETFKFADEHKKEGYEVIQWDEFEEDNNLPDFFAELENIQPMRKSAYKTASAQAIRQALIQTRGDVKADVKLVS
jgi:hypothetical protein